MTPGNPAKAARFDVIAWLDQSDIRSDLFDNASAFMSRHDRQR